ncbi:MAG: hypothetical protein LQ340_003200 [Diploschistes diacapsis]|nr:MAG: hypothetical protein LQ340_003200 [Diploschistes diacapsis]
MVNFIKTAAATISVLAVQALLYASPTSAHGYGYSGDVGVYTRDADADAEFLDYNELAARSHEIDSVLAARGLDIYDHVLMRRGDSDRRSKQVHCGHRGCGSFYTTAPKGAQITCPSGHSFTV